MELKTWLTTKGIRPDEFGKLVDIAGNRAYRIMVGRTDPGTIEALAIFNATRGVVTLADMAKTRQDFLNSEAGKREQVRFADGFKKLEPTE